MQNQIKMQLVIILTTLFSLMGYAQQEDLPIVYKITPSFGYAGTSSIIKIKGKNFKKKTTVVFSEFIELKSIEFINEEELNATIKINSNAPTKIIEIGVVDLDNFKISEPSDWQIFERRDTIKPSIDILLSKEVRNKLNKEIEREKFKLEINKSKVDLQCLKRSLIRVIENQGFEFHQPIFNDENQLETYHKDFRAVVMYDTRRYEKVVVSVWISERESTYRIYMSASGQQRRRESDLDQSEPIPKEYLERYVDKMIVNLNLKKCDTKNLEIVLKWNEEVDLDIHILTPSMNTINYKKKQSKEGFLEFDNQRGFGPENCIIRTNYSGDFQVVIEYFNGKKPTNGTIEFIKDNRVIKKCHFRLEIKKEKWQTLFSIHNKEVSVSNQCN